MRRFDPLAAILGAFGLIMASAGVASADQVESKDSLRVVVKVTAHEVPDLRVAVEMAFASRSPGVWLARRQDTTSKKQDTTKKAAPKTPKQTAKKPPVKSKGPEFIAVPTQVDTAKIRRDGERQGAINQRIHDDSVNRSTDSLNKARIARLEARNDSLRTNSAAGALPLGPRSARTLPISKEHPETPPPRQNLTPPPPTPKADTFTVYKTDTLRLTGPTVFKTDTLRLTKTDTTTKTVVVKNGHNPWPWIFGIAVVGGATTYFVCHNNNNCRGPRSSSCAINVVNPTNGQIPSCPASSKSRGVGMSWGFQF